jgi:hypothetical protein
MKHLKLLTVLLSATVWISCDKDDDDHYPPHNEVKATVVKGSGDLTATIDEFKNLVGNVENVAPDQTGGHRRITWDGVPPAFTNQNNFPLDFFNITDPAGPNARKKGLVYANTGAIFRVDSSSYSQIEATYANNFKPFSGKRLVTAINTNVSELVFKVAATNTDATISGFGIVFSDVDNADYTTVEFYNGNKSLGTFKAPVRSDANGHSFLGVFFPEEKITRVKIVSGNGILNGQKDVTDGGQKDLVVFDDFFYSEPVAK